MRGLCRRQNEFLGWVLEGLRDSSSVAFACIGFLGSKYIGVLQGQLMHVQALIEGDETFVQPVARRNEVLGWVREGLRDFSISRAAVAWGIPIPRDPAQTVYVWFDALLGYMSGALAASGILESLKFDELSSFSNARC